ncbi:hypothetical protein ACU8KH_01045 [Lachancea thermotolerans]
MRQLSLEIVARFSRCQIFMAVNILPFLRLEIVALSMLALLLPQIIGPKHLRPFSSEEV